MATLVNSTEKDAGRIAVLVTPNQFVADLYKEMEAAGYKRFDPSKVFSRSDWLIESIEQYDAGIKYVMHPASKMTGDAKVFGMIRNKMATAYAIEMEKDPAVNG